LSFTKSRTSGKHVEVQVKYRENISHKRKNVFKIPFYTYIYSAAVAAFSINTMHLAYGE